MPRTQSAHTVRKLNYSAEEACKAIGIGKTLFYSLVSRGIAPQPVRIGRRCLWPVEEIEQFVRDRMEQREAS